jgi:hypothetical protein
LFPPPAATYHRSVALQHQISLLEQHPTFDYVITPPAPLDDVAMAFQKPELAELFRENR